MLCRYGCKSLLSYKSIPTHLRMHIARKVRELCVQEVDEIMQRDRWFAEEVSLMHIVGDRQQVGSLELHPCVCWVLRTFLFSSAVYMLSAVLVACWVWGCW